MTKKKLNEISRLLNGYAFKSSKYVQSGLRVIRIANVQDGYLSDSEPCFYPIETTTKLEQFLLKPHDLLMSLTGNVGRVAFIEKEYLPAGLNQRVECIRPFKETDKEYLYYFFRSPMFQRESLKASHGSAQLNLSTVWLANFYVVYPDEEKRKTAVNTLRTIDNLIREKRNQLIELDSLVKSRFMEMFGEWNLSFQKENWIKLSDLTNIYTGTTPKTEIEEYWNGLIPWVTPAELDKDSYLITDTERHITEKGQKSKSLTMMPIGTVLLSTRAPIGKVAICGVPMTCNQGFKNFECLEKLHPTYLFYLLKLNNDWLQTQGTGTTFKEISKSKAGNIRIPVPTMSDQKDFAQFYNLVDKSRFVVQKEIKEKQELLDSKMDEYFGGEE